MLDNTITITYSGDTITLNRLNQDGYTGNFYGKSADGLTHFNLEVKHSFPKGSSAGVEQHLVKLTRTVTASVGGVISIVSDSSVHIVLKQSVGVQVNTELLALQNALETLTADVFVTKILDRRS